MLKKMIKKVIFAVLLLYGFNLISVSFNMIIPINLITILIVSILDFSGMLMLIFSALFVF